jgi:hypothetical protein
MANLRIDDQRRVAPGQAPGQFDAPDASRGAEFASRQMQQTGQALSQAGQAVGAIYRAEVEKQNETRVNDALNRAQASAQQDQTEWSQLRGEAAIAVGENREPVDQVYAPRFERRVNEIADELQLTPEQRQQYQARVAPLALRVRGSLTEHFARENGTYQEQVYTSGVMQAQEVIRANASDPELVRLNTQRIAELTDAESRRRGLPAAAAVIANRTNVGKALADVVTDLADEDVDAAQAFFDANYENMTADQRDKARTVLRPAIEARTAEQVADMFGPRLGGTVAAPGGASSFDQSMVSIWQSEGTALVADDNGAGRARFGITERSHPAAWADGEVTREEANAIYKRDYWDAIGADDLPAGMAHMAFDTAVNMGAGRARQLLDQAGGDVTKFAQLRRDEYRRIAAEDADGSSRQYLAGWLERTDKVEMEARGQAPAGPDRAPTMSVSQAVAAARAALPPGAPPSLVRATEAEVRRRYTEFDQAEAEGFEEADAEAFRHIEANRSMPGANIIARLKPGRLQTIRNYFEAVTAPPVVRTDPDLELALASDLSWLDMTHEEFIGRYGARLSASDRVQYASQLTRAATAAGNQVREQAQSARVVPAQVFGQAVNDALDIRGIDRTNLPDADRQERAMFVSSLRSSVLQAQIAKGSQLTEPEVRRLVTERLEALTWERPGGLFGGRPTNVVSVGYDEMNSASVQAARERLRSYGNNSPTEDQIYENYLLYTVNRVR